MRILRLLGVIVGVIVLFSCGYTLMNPGRPAPAAAPITRQTVTINGVDSTTGNDISPINLWDNYETRGAVTGRVMTGERVTLLQRVGAGALVEKADGSQGWLTATFIKELR